MLLLFVAIVHQVPSALEKRYLKYILEKQENGIF